MEPEGSVLLVDDNTSMLETLRDILEISGFQVDTSVDAEDAAGKFQTNNYDVAVVDVVLPRMNGVDLVRKLKPSYPNTSFVIFTAYTDSRLVHEALAEGLADILDKPVDPAELVATVKRLVQEDRGDRPESSCSTRPGVVRGLR